MYQFKAVTLKNGPHQRKVLVIDFTSPKMAIVGEFLMADAALLGGEILQEIDAVLAGEKDIVHSSGNRCAVEINAFTTQITDIFEGMDGVESYPAYAISTEELRDLIVIWLKKLEEF